MPRISKNKISKEMGKFIWERLVEAFKEAKTEKDVEEIERMGAMERTATMENTQQLWLLWDFH